MRPLGYYVDEAFDLPGQSIDPVASLKIEEDGALVIGAAWEHYSEHLRTKISPKTKKPRSERHVLEHINLSSRGSLRA